MPEKSHCHAKQAWPRQTTVNSRLADTSLLRTPRYYGQQRNPQRKLQTFDWNELPLLRTLAITDLQTLYSVPMSQFYCFLIRYSGHRATSWNICIQIKSIFSAFFLLKQNNHFEKFQGRSGQCPNHFCFFDSARGFKVANEFLGDKVGEFKGELNIADWNDILRQ